MIELFNIDCMEYMAGLPDKAFDLAIVDPPYGIGADKHNLGSWRAGRLPKGNWDVAPGGDYFDRLQRISKHQIIWGANHFLDAFPFMCNSPSWLVWDKGASFKGKTFAEAELAWTNLPGGVRVYSRDPLACRDYLHRQHRAQKPVQLYAWILSKFSKPGQRILDTHLGSGSSAIAAHYFGVDFVGCEIDSHYFKAAKERFDQETRQVSFL